jgi:type IV pilus biogenesis protein CpaD/CtpE
MKKKIFPYLVIFMMIAGMTACASKPKEVTEEVTKETTVAQPVIQKTTTTTTTQ